MRSASDAARAVEAVARGAYGRLVAFLAARSRDVAAAEDALSDAFAAALRAWPESGVPARPEAWLLTAARRRMMDQARHGRVRDAAEGALLMLAEGAAPEHGFPDERLALLFVCAHPAIDAAIRTPLMLQCVLGLEAAPEHGFPDERLALLFVCAHPAIDAAIRTPLMLQCVLGLEAARIAEAFLVAPATMGQRLARAKAKIRVAGIAFAVPGADELAPRLGFVMEAIYAAFTAGWDDAGRPGLAEEAVFLARVLVAQLPQAAEARGLLALMLLALGRHPARRDGDGRFVPLSEQDPARWDTARIAEGMAELGRAAAAGTPGRYQLEAAIQALHCVRPTDWQEVALLYEGLLDFAPTVGVRVARAAAVSEAMGAAVGLALLDEIAGAGEYQPYWAVRAHLLALSGRPAAEAARRAVALSGDAAVRMWLERKYVLF